MPTLFTKLKSFKTPTARAFSISICELSPNAAPVLPEISITKIIFVSPFFFAPVPTTTGKICSNLLPLYPPDSKEFLPPIIKIPLPSIAKFEILSLIHSRLEILSSLIIKELYLVKSAGKAETYSTS